MLSENPIQKSRFLESSLPDFMADPRIFRIARFSAGLLDGLNHFSRFPHRDRRIRGPMKCPDWNVGDPGCICDTPAPTQRNCGSKNVRPERNDRPRSVTTHRLTGYVEALCINTELLLQRFDYFENRLQLAGTGPSLVRRCLRSQHEGRILRLVFRTSPGVGSKCACRRDLFSVVVADAAAAMQPEHERIFF